MCCQISMSFIWYCDLSILWKKGIATLDTQDLACLSFFCMLLENDNIVEKVEQMIQKAEKQHFGSTQSALLINKEIIHLFLMEILQVILFF